MSKKFMRRIIFLLAAIFMISCGSFVYADTVDSGTCGENVTWTLDSDGVLTFSGEGEMENYNNYSDVPWYSHREVINNVIIEQGVTSIGSYAFYWCSSVTSVTLPDSVTIIGSCAFGYCTGMTSVTLPNNVTIIGSWAFMGCSSLTSVNIPNGVTSIEGAFDGCTSLTSISIPGSVTSMDDAFNGCSNLTSVNIQNGVTSIGYDTFAYCKSLTSVEIPSSVTSIEAKAFRDCSSLTSVTLPDSVTAIGSGAFWNCIGLTSVIIPNTVTYIGPSAFDGCKNLISITIPSQLTSIESGAFRNCSNLTSVTLPESVTSIGASAFHGCNRLTSIYIPDSVASIGETYGNIYSVFDGCKDLVIYGNMNSCAYDYAKEWDISFCCLSHKNIVTIPAVASSCTTTGLTEGKKCDDCDTITVVQKVIPAGHKKITVEGKAPTCTKTGLTEGTKCSNCGVLFVQQELIPAKGHKYGSWKTVTSATCTTTGKQQRTCSSCKKVNSKTIAKLGHNYSTAWTVDKKASVSAAGSKSHHCKRCDAKKNVTKISKIKSIKLSKTSYVYNGSAKNPTVIIKDANGKTISSKNYTVTKAKGRTNVGKYSYKIIFKNEYKGTKTLYFKINPKATIIKTPVVAKKAFTVKWSKVSKQATGYEIMYATNSKFTTGKKTVKVTSYKTTSKKISKLTAKKIYYVKVRTYKTVDGVKYYSTWSDVKKVKIK